MSEPRDPVREEREWREWSEGFHAEGSAGAEEGLRAFRTRTLRRARLEARGGLAFSVALAAFGIGFTAWDPEPWRIAWTVLLFAFLLPLTVFTIWNQRDVLWPRADAQADHLASALLRHQRELRMLWILPPLFVAEVVAGIAFFLIWAPRALWVASPLYLVLGLAAALYWRNRRARIGRERQVIEDIRSQLLDQ